MRKLKHILCPLLIGAVLSSCRAVTLDDSISPVSSKTWPDEGGKSEMILQIEKKTFSVQLEENETAGAFIELLPMAITMSELNGNEKYFYLTDSLPTNSKVPGRIEAGDVMLYGSKCLVIFYESFDTVYSYTPIGHINDPIGLKDALGSGSISVELKQSK